MMVGPGQANNMTQFESQYGGLPMTSSSSLHHDPPPPVHLVYDRQPTKSADRPRIQLLGPGVSVNEGDEGVIPQAVFLGEPAFGPAGVNTSESDDVLDRREKRPTPPPQPPSRTGFERPGMEVGAGVKGHPIQSYRTLQGSELLEQVSEAARSTQEAARSTSSTQESAMSTTRKLPKAIVEKIPVFPGGPGGQQEHQQVRPGLVQSRSMPHPNYEHHYTTLPSQGEAPIQPQSYPPENSHGHPLHTHTHTHTHTHIPQHFHQTDYHPNSHYYGPPPEVNHHQAAPPETPHYENVVDGQVDGPFQHGGWYGLNRKLANPPVPFETPVLKDTSSDDHPNSVASATSTSSSSQVDQYRPFPFSTASARTANSVAEAFSTLKIATAKSFTDSHICDGYDKP